MTETNLMRKIMLAIGSSPNVRVYRNNVGVAYAQNGGIVRYGLCVGSSDLIGWRTVTVTPDMVGQRLAVFTALEVKTNTGRPTQEQQNFIRAVREAGGIAEVVRTPEDARKLLL